MDQEEDKENSKEQISIPLLPLRDSVIYPFMVIPLFVSRSKSVKSLETCVTSGKQIFFVAQRDPKSEDPKLEDLYTVGTIANVLQVLKLPDGTVKVLAEGMNRGKILTITESEHLVTGAVEIINDIIHNDNETEALVRSITNKFEDFIKLNSKIPVEIMSALTNMNDPGRLADAVTAHLPLLKIEERQQILETRDTKDRLEIVMKFLNHELEILKIEDNLKQRVKSQLDKTQREFYLNEKLKAIQKELDNISDHRIPLTELEKIKIKINKIGLSIEVKEKALIELNKLKMMPPLSAEATVYRNYLDWILDLPWKKMSKINTNLQKASVILNNDHYGLEKIKERIVEYLAVQSRSKKMHGPILCLVGPPGVGKTSLGKSIAKATGRKFIRISLGGMRDEAEIRGHRRTYIGSLPGKIIQKMAKVKVCNPLFMLDEIDKMAMDFRGDPASALLEVLDPEQNHAFNDYYLEVDYDLSNVMFIATANSLDIPSPLLDRMEVLSLSGYTDDEKFNIAVKYLLPKQIKENGLRSKEINFTHDALKEIIHYYTREAGVRNLEREISKVCRKIVKKITLEGKNKRETVTNECLEQYLGVPIYHPNYIVNEDRIGQVHGLAWTETGGELLTIEVTAVNGKGKTMYTGHLGEVMQESISTALTVVRSKIKTLGISKDFYGKTDIHVHVPEGATPKDGPSAGIGMCTALVSALTNIPVYSHVAMTGEITLRGEVLQIGGLKEKLLAAIRSRIKIVIIPDSNVRELKELPSSITENLEIKPVKWIEQVLEIALNRKMQKAKK